MKNRLFAGLSALALVGAGGVVASIAMPAIADSRSDAAALKRAADFAKAAAKATAKKKWDKAILFAENAVVLSPDDAGYRALLGNAYLRAGRFASAEDSFADVMTLQPDNGRIALNLALAQIGTGKWAAARATLERGAGVIPAADRGLALALAGDTQGAIDVLTAATRSADADVKTRQNLALAMALAGRWQESRTLVAMDLAPAEVDKRMTEWAQFAHPVSAADQVASLLGVTPVVDPGRPTALALAASAPATATADAAVDRYMPGRAPAPEAAPAVETQPVVVASTTSDAAPAAVDSPTPVAEAVAPEAQPSAVRSPVAVAAVKVRPVRTIASRGGYKTALAAAPQPVAAPAMGNWYVQLGAYENSAVARDGWARLVRRYPAFAGHTPAGVKANVRGASFYRLSVGGFARADAASLCRGYRAKGGACFIRTGAGDQVASWARRGTGVQVARRGTGIQVASR